MRIVYWGTPAYAVPSLDALLAAGHEVVGVVSQPDRRRGRGGQRLPSPVKARAAACGIPVWTPQRIRHEPELQHQLAGLGADVHVVVAFGQILPAAVLEQARLGCWNGHGSLLPRWRGAAPIQWALLEGDSETGVGIMAMEESLDTGPVLLERRLGIGLKENAWQLAERLSTLTAHMMVEALPLVAAGRLQLRAQREQGITYATRLEKHHFVMDWGRSALALHRQVMGLYPNALSRWKGRRLKLLDSEPLVQHLRDQLTPEAADLAAVSWPATKPGTVLDLIRGQGLVIATGTSPLLVRQAQLEGRSALQGSDLIHALGIARGDCLC